MISLFQILPLENNKDLFNHKLIIKCAVPGTLAITPRRALDKEVDPIAASYIRLKFRDTSTKFVQIKQYCSIKGYDRSDKYY